MFFLLLAMMASSVLAIVLRYLNTGYAYGVYFINYVTCAVLAFATLEGKTLWTGDPTPLWLWAVAGFFYLSSLAAHGYSIHKNGAILSSVFTRVLVPIFPALLLFHGRTTPAQGLGVGLAVLAAVVMNGLPKSTSAPPGGKSSTPWPWCWRCSSTRPATVCPKYSPSWAAGRTTAYPSFTSSCSPSCLPSPATLTY